MAVFRGRAERIAGYAVEALPHRRYLIRRAMEKASA
jgi:hypothetical protein